MDKNETKLKNCMRTTLAWANVVINLAMAKRENTSIYNVGFLLKQMDGQSNEDTKSHDMGSFFNILVRNPKNHALAMKRNHFLNCSK